jgi:hypothetical protein
MKKVLLVSAAVFTVGSFGAAQAAHRTAAVKVPVCHKTSSKTKPYQRIVVSGSALKKAQASSDDIVPAPKSCPQTLLSATGGGVQIGTKLLGVAEQPEVGDPDGTGTATIRLRVGQARVCFSIDSQNIGAPTAAHIHKGTPLESGPAVVPLTTAGAGCVPATRVLVKDILANKASYYVNVHTAEFANGAIRGQLAPVPTALLFTANLAGANQKPNPADANGVGSGQFLVDATGNRVCYGLSVKNITLPSTAAHIHRGDANTAGPVVVPFVQPGTSGTSSGCVTADPAIVKEILANPANFYANVHTTQYPAGAVRGQLTVS